MYRVYGFSSCPWCKRAQAALASAGLVYEYVAIEDPVERVRFMDERGFEGSQRTFPRVYYGDELVGGCTELEDRLLGF